MEEIEIVPPATIVLLSNVMSGVAAALPAVPWNSPAVSAAPFANTRKYPAVPLASALMSGVIALAVAVPVALAPNAVAPKVLVPSSVPEEASATLAGGAPVRMAIVPLLQRAVIALQAAFLGAVPNLKLLGMADPTLATGSKSKAC